MSIKNKILSKIPSTTVTNLTNNFTQIKKFQSSDVAAYDRFGWSVAANDTKIVVGAPYEDTTASAAGSIYIFDMNGNQLAKIQASNAGSGDRFGTAVAVSNTRIVVGAHYEDTTASNAGSVYIFDIDGNQLAKIQASNAGSGDNFGRSVACSDTRIVVGAWYEDTTASNAGSAYIFDIDGNQLAKIQASDAGSTDNFSYAVACSDTRIVVGAPYADTTASDAGSAYIFDIDGNQLAKIQASDAAEYDRFGIAVAVSDTRIVVGAPLEDAAGANSNAGAAYVFNIDGTELAKINAGDAVGGSQFGNSVAISDTRIVVGSEYNSTGYTYAGAVYVFKNFYNNIPSINFRKLRHLFTGTI